MKLVVIALALVFAVAFGCARDDESKPLPQVTKPPPITKAVQDRGEAACNAFAKRACKCAESDASLAFVCEDASARPKALNYAVRAARGRGIEERVRGRLVLEVQRIIEKCFEDDNKLPPTCPR